MPKHFFFDLDKTLTTSRSPLTVPHEELFDKLCAQNDVVVVSGGSSQQIREQITPRFDGRYFILAQSGNEAYDKSGTALWNEPLTEPQVKEIVAFIEKLKEYFNVPVKNENDLWENRGAQVSYSVIGFHEDIDKKYAFDPSEEKRQAALKALGDDRIALANAGVEVTPAGTTTFNFLPKGKHKGFNILRLIKQEAWRTEESIYVGDALFPGGNDESVIGIIPTYAVTNPDDTFKYIESIVSAEKANVVH
ncbi:HAD-IIB family hydrolase [Candidatus Parcubacteria bacterium]|nr:MAG: HAD-IIB family hydrolase [Candidatus Parcubacteria bacterium]